MTHEKIYRLNRSVLELFQDPTKHTTGAMARDRYRANVGARSAHATCWCLMGAARLFSGSNNALVTQILWVWSVQIEQQTGTNYNVDVFNDRYPLPEIIKMLTAVDERYGKQIGVTSC